MSAQFNGPSGDTVAWRLYEMPSLTLVWQGPGPIPPGVMDPGTTYRLVHVTDAGNAEIEFTTPGSESSGNHIYDSLGG